MTASLAGAGNVSFPRVHRVSVRSNGAQAVNGGSSYAAISNNGRYVVFESDATNLVANDGNGASDIFVHDRETGDTRRVSVESDGDEGEVGEHSYDAKISASGRRIVFYSDAELVGSDDNGVPDVFLHNTETDKTKRVSVSSNGEQAELSSSDPAISANGKVVAFASEDEGLVPNDDNSYSDVFVHILKTGKTRLVSVRSNGDQGEGNGSHSPALSRNGGIVGFASDAENLVPGDDNTASDVFVHVRRTNKTKRVSVQSDGGQADGSSSDPELSDSGRIVAYESHAIDLVPNDENEEEDVFAFDRQSKKTRRVSVSSAGVEGDFSSEDTGLTSDGRYVVYETTSALVGNDDNNNEDIYMHDRQTKTTRRASLRSNGQESLTGDSGEPEVSDGGRYVVFHSSATDLVAASDTNNFFDVFVRGPLP